jgi:hypothetical protein
MCSLNWLDEGLVRAVLRNNSLLIGLDIVGGSGAFFEDLGRLRQMLPVKRVEVSGSSIDAQCNNINIVTFYQLP